jgi:hypothetical protein
MNRYDAFVVKKEITKTQKTTTPHCDSTKKKGKVIKGNQFQCLNEIQKNN